MASERRDAGAVRSLVNARSLKLERARALRESFLVPFLTYGSETMIWREKESYRARGCTDGQPLSSGEYQENG